MYDTNSINSQANYIQQNQAIPKIDKFGDDVKLKEQTDAFESIMIKMVMDNAAKNEKNIFSQENDPGDKIYKSMYRDELAKVSSGSFGFSQMLYDFLSRKG